MRRPILAEYIPPKIKRLYKRLPRFDVGELPRDRLGERRTLVMSARDAPPPVSKARSEEHARRVDAELFESHERMRVELEKPIVYEAPKRADDAQTSPPMTGR